MSLLGSTGRKVRSTSRVSLTPGARTLLHRALGTSAAILTCSRPLLCSSRTQPPGGGSGALTCVPSPVSQRRRRTITCPETAAGAAGPGPARLLTPGDSGSADCPAVRSGEGRAMTARGNSVTAAEGPGPWLKSAGPNDRWAARRPPPPRRSVLTTSAWRPLWLRKQPGSRRNRTSLLNSCLPEVSRFAPSGGAEELSFGLAKWGETTEAGSTGLSIS